MLVLRRLLLPVVPLVLVACGGGDEDGDAVDDATAPVEADDAPSDVTRSPVDPSAPVDVVVRGANDAGLAMLRTQYAGNDVVLSPTSVATAFAMAAAGADEPTRTGLDATFGFPPGDALGAAMNTLTADLVADPLGDDLETPIFELAKATWVQEGEAVGADFERVLAEQYGAGVEQVDFADTEAARSDINGWIAERTRDRIPELIAAPGLPADTRTALVNAAYFKAGWQTPFEESATAPAPFTTAAGAVVQADTMNASLSAAFVLDEDVTVVHLPYLGGEYVMTIAMPDAMDEFLAPVDGEAWSTLSAVATTGPVELALPRWEATTTVELSPLLSELGLAIPGGSYPGILDGATVGTVVHGANIAVDEAGTEAAAATVVVMPTGAPAPGPEPVRITIDRPFVYTITHAPTATILFAGIETDPTT